jgi:purine-binding chemotaxis protein CheW
MRDNIEIVQNINSEINAKGVNKFVTVKVNNQVIAVSALVVKDVLLPQKITPVPLVSADIVGLLNLRGRVVTAVDLRIKMGMPPADDRVHNKSIVIEFEDNLYSFIVDDVTGVCDIPTDEIESVPDNLSEVWKEYCIGIYKLEKELMVIINIESLLIKHKSGE